jgi:hypothetical protein
MLIRLAYTVEFTAEQFLVRKETFWTFLKDFRTRLGNGLKRSKDQTVTIEIYMQNSSKRITNILATKISRGTTNNNSNIIVFYF